jgi:outer membrane protein TolC
MSPSRRPPRRHRRGATLLAAGLALLTGCSGARTAPPRPLDPHATWEEAVRERAVPPILGRPLTLAHAVAALRASNPEIREARARLEAARAVAAVRTPRANPTFTLGPLFLNGADVLSAGSWGLETALGWVVPLSRERVLQDHLNAVLAAEAEAEAAATERREYLALRGEMLAFALGAQTEAARGELALEAREAAVAARRLADSGALSALDVSVLSLDAARAEGDAMRAREETLLARHRLARRMGRSADVVPSPEPAALPVLPAEAPDLAGILDLVPTEHPQLAVLRARFLVAEKALRLECARAVPDLVVGPSYERAAGVNRFGFPFAIDVPIHDRNQPGIARALAERETVRARYLAAQERILGEVHSAWALLDSRRVRAEALHGVVLAEAEAAADLARRAAAAGEADALRVLEVQRARRSAAVDAAQATLDLAGAWAALEQAAGLPLLEFPEAPGAPAAPKEE